MPIFVFVSGVCLFYFHWPSGLSVMGAVVGTGRGALVAGLLVDRPVGVLPPWGVITVSTPWPMGTQPPLATRALIKLLACSFYLPISSTVQN